MAYFASYADRQLVRARITIPSWGMASADAVMSDPSDIPATGSLVVGNLTLAVAVVRTGGYAGSREVRFVGGAGGWRRQVQPRAYRAQGGVKLSTVLSDVAKDCGEQVTVAASADRLLGGFYARQRAAASRVLRQTVGTGWYVDPDGVTQVGERPAPTISSEKAVVEFDTAKGIAWVATDDIAAWQPGALFSAPTFEGTRAVTSVSIDMLNAGRLRLVVMTS